MYYYGKKDRPVDYHQRKCRECDLIASQHASQLDVITTFTDSQGDLVGLHIDIGRFVFLIQLDGRDFGGIEGAGDE